MPKRKSNKERRTNLFCIFTLSRKIKRRKAGSKKAIVILFVRLNPKRYEKRRINLPPFL
ncbi:hypothetical protein ES703_10742 [subsurface metagenome]